LTLSDADPWDRRLLGDVLEFDHEISQFGDGFNKQFAGQAASPAFYVDFVSLSSTSFLQRYLNRDPAEILIGLVLAQRFVDKVGSNTARVFPPMLGERQQGATWGLIAKERGLPLQPLLQAVLDAIRHGTTPQAAGGGGGGGGFGGGNPPRQSPSPQPTGKPKPKPTHSPTSNPTPPPSPTPCGTLEKLLGLCTGAGSAGSSASTNAPPACSITGVLLDPKC
jgi:hypothetical protein